VQRSSVGPVRTRPEPTPKGYEFVKGSVKKKGFQESSKEGLVVNGRLEV
jgi:hypothetical protein